MPSSPSLIISSFWFKVRDVQLFLSLQHFEDIVRLLIGLISILLCLIGEGDKGMASWWSSLNIYNIYWLSSPSFMIVLCGTPKPLQQWHQRLLITYQHSKDHQPNNNDNNVWNIATTTKMWHTHKVSKFCWKKMAPTNRLVLCWVDTRLQFT